MPTPTIDPMAYEAAYKVVRQYNIDMEIISLIFAGIALFIWWLCKE